RSTLEASIVEHTRRLVASAGPSALMTYLKSHGLANVVDPPSTTPPPSPSPTPTTQPKRFIQVVNQSTSVPKDEFLKVVAAVQKQISQDFVIFWGLDCVLSPVMASSTTFVQPKVETLYVLDDSDQAGALGYHTLTDADFPVGFVFARTTKKSGGQWSETLSHEVLEQLADPFVTTAAVVNFLGKPRAVAYETADPVEADSYAIDGVSVSNFVTPQWFQDFLPPTDIKLDFLGRLKKPLTLTPGGYVAYSTDLMNWENYFTSHDLLTKAAVVRSHREKIDEWCRRSRRNSH